MCVCLYIFMQEKRCSLDVKRKYEISLFFSQYNSKHANGCVDFTATIVKMLIRVFVYLYLDTRRTQLTLFLFIFCK